MLTAKKRQTQALLLILRSGTLRVVVFNNTGTRQPPDTSCLLYCTVADSNCNWWGLPDGGAKPYQSRNAADPYPVEIGGYPFTLGQFTNNAALILPPEADQHWSKIFPLSASETFTQRRVRRIDAGSPHANGSVNGAINSRHLLSQV